LSSTLRNLASTRSADSADGHGGTIAPKGASLIDAAFSTLVNTAIVGADPADTTSGHGKSGAFDRQASRSNGHDTNVEPSSAEASGPPSAGVRADEKGNTATANADSSAPKAVASIGPSLPQVAVASDAHGVKSAGDVPTPAETHRGRDDRARRHPAALSTNGTPPLVTGLPVALPTVKDDHAMGPTQITTAPKSTGGIASTKPASGPPPTGRHPATGIADDAPATVVSVTTPTSVATAATSSPPSPQPATVGGMRVPSQAIDQDEAAAPAEGPPLAPNLAPAPNIAAVHEGAAGVSAQSSALHHLDSPSTALTPTASPPPSPAAMTTQRVTPSKTITASVRATALVAALSSRADVKQIATSSATPPNSGVQVARLTAPFAGTGNGPVPVRSALSLSAAPHGAVTNSTTPPAELATPLPATGHGPAAGNSAPSAPPAAPALAPTAALSTPTHRSPIIDSLPPGVGPAESLNRPPPLGTPRADQASIGGVAAASLNPSPLPSAAPATGAAGTNATTPTPLAADVSKHMLDMIKAGRSEATIQLQPPQLGPITIRVAVQGRDVSAWFGTAQPQVQQAVAHALDQLQIGLAGAGLNLAGAWVGADASGTRQPLADRLTPVRRPSFGATSVTTVSGGEVDPGRAPSGVNIYV
jgi:flagellar hook-length control protein FliK